MASIMTCPVVSKQQLNERYCLIGLHAPEIVETVQTGQFINVQVPTTGHDPLLKRPLSVHKVDREAGVVYILFKVVGRGTEILREVVCGARLQIMGPLGNGFTLRGEEDVLLVGGGIGAAPLYELAQRLTALGSRVTLLLGLTDVQDLVLAGVLEEFAPRVILMRGDEATNGTLATEQGGTEVPVEPEPGLAAGTGLVQAGERKFPKGLVTELLAQELRDWHYSQVYVCGPKPMLAAVQQMLGERKGLAQFSLEEKMGCGVGLCFSCTCKVKDETKTDQWSNERVCTHGPVFAGDEVIFDD